MAHATLTGTDGLPLTVDLSQATLIRAVGTGTEMVFPFPAGRVRVLESPGDVTRLMAAIASGPVTPVTVWVLTSWGRLGQDGRVVGAFSDADKADAWIRERWTHDLVTRDKELLVWSVTSTRSETLVEYVGTEVLVDGRP